MNSQGFTLIEVLVYIGLLSIIITGCLSVSYFMLDASRKVDSAININEEENFVLKKLSWVLDGINGIISPAENQTGASLSLNKNNFSQNPLVLSASSGILNMQEGTGSPLPLNTQKLFITNFNVQRIKNPTNEEIIINFTANGQSFNITKYLK